jgi:5-methyltetrahydropteroyltriglutamate--homocysteine methyltransferase
MTVVNVSMSLLQVRDCGRPAPPSGASTVARSLLVRCWQGLLLYMDRVGITCLPAEEPDMISRSPAIRPGFVPDCSETLERFCVRRSDERILTTHTGSLPRPDHLVTVLAGRDQQALHPDPQFDERIREAVIGTVRRQVQTGLDVVNDGEMAKVGYATYVTERLTGFEGENADPRGNVEQALFPEYYRWRPLNTVGISRPLCTGPIAWRGAEQVRADIARIQSALSGVEVADCFMTSASPGVIWSFLDNAYYPDDEAYVFAIARAMGEEYRQIVDSGLVLQVDCPDLASGWGRPMFAGRTVADFLEVAEMHVAALNAALSGIPEDRVRLHLCWGNFVGPHMRDIPLSQIWATITKARAQAFSFEGANPRHAHEWTLFHDVRLPPGSIVIPGVIDSTTNFVEHPELIAQRIVRYAGLVGRDAVIAGTDCGFSTFVRARPVVHPTVAWAKLAALVEGASLATAQLWR